MTVSEMKIRKAQKQIQLDRLDEQRDELAGEIDDLSRNIRDHYARMVDDGRPIRMEMVMEGNAGTAEI